MFRETGFHRHLVVISSFSQPLASDLILLLLHLPMLHVARDSFPFFPAADDIRPQGSSTPISMNFFFYFLKREHFERFS
jgi:hypothetical protein